MTLARFSGSVLALFVFALAWNGLVHFVVLREANLALLEIARPAEERNMAVALLLTLGIAAVFVWTFTIWTKEGSRKEGILHGVVFTILAGLLVDLNQYLVYPIPGSLALKWFLFGALEFMCYGLIVSALYRLGTVD
jgi:hypothetical protein